MSFLSRPVASAIGTKQTLLLRSEMSAFEAKADILKAKANEPIKLYEYWL
jgi:hypothetical protein